MRAFRASPRISVGFRYVVLRYSVNSQGAGTPGTSLGQYSSRAVMPIQQQQQRQQQCWYILNSRSSEPLWKLSLLVETIGQRIAPRHLAIFVAGEDLTHSAAVPSWETNYIGVQSGSTCTTRGQP